MEFPTKYAIYIPPGGQPQCGYCGGDVPALVYSNNVRWERSGPGGSLVFRDGGRVVHACGRDWQDEDETGRRPKWTS